MYPKEIQGKSLFLCWLSSVCSFHIFISISFIPSLSNIFPFSLLYQFQCTQTQFSVFVFTKRFVLSRTTLLTHLTEQSKHNLNYEI